MPAWQQLGNPGRRHGPAQPGGISCSPVAPRCVTRSRRDPHLVPLSPGGSRWGQMESHQEHAGTRTSLYPPCPCPAVAPAQLSAAGGGQGDAAGRHRALPSLLQPTSGAWSIPTLPSTPSPGATENPPSLTPTVPMPVNTNNDAPLTRNNASPLVVLRHGNNSQLPALRKRRERTRVATARDRSPPWGPGALGCPGEPAPRSWGGQGGASTGLPGGARGCAGGCGFLLLSTPAWGHALGAH